MAGHDADKRLDPARSILDFAKLAARLADPFAVTAAVFADAGTSAEAYRAATERWAQDLKGNEGLRRIFAEIYRRELSGAPPEATSPDETQLAKPIAFEPVLPFAHGRFQPAPAAPPPKRDRRADDPDATQLPSLDPHVTLPFPKPKPR